MEASRSRAKVGTLFSRFSRISNASLPCARFVSLWTTEGGLGEGSGGGARGRARQEEEKEQEEEGEEDGIGCGNVIFGCIHSVSKVYLSCWLVPGHDLADHVFVKR